MIIEGIAIKQIVVKGLFSQLLRITGKLLLLGKRGLEKEYKYYKLFRRCNKASKLEDKPESIYLESIYQYENDRGNDLAKLFYLDDAFNAFFEFYNHGEEWSLEAKLDDTLHTSKEALNLKNKNINLQNEIALFIEIYQRVTTLSSSQSNIDILKGQEKLMNIFLNYINWRKPGSNPVKTKFEFNGHIQRPEKMIPRKIISCDSNAGKSFFTKIEKSDLINVCRSHNKIVLLANGGMGKSLELKKLAFSFDEDEYIPIYNTFRSYTNGKIEDLLPKDWSEVPSKKSLLILDGLDEIDNSHFLAGIKSLNSFVERYPDIKVVVSCRTNHLDTSQNELGGYFKSYYLDGINIYSTEVKEYMKNQFGVDGENFTQDIIRLGFIDLVENPFYLNKMLEIYSKEGRFDLSRSQLFEQFITSNADFDQQKYNLSIEDVRYKQQKLFKLLEYIALVAESLGKNELTTEELYEIITDESDLELIKYTKNFRKLEIEEKWQFEHRLIQEYIVARTLSKHPLDKILDFIAFKGKKKIIPSWANTFTFLFSIISDKDKLRELTDWVVENDRDSIIRVEREKVPEALRIQIFQGIFNHYKKYDVWIKSNKFIDKELARFGQSADNIRFLIDEIKNAKNSRTVRINAISLIGHFELEDAGIKQEVEELILKQIEDACNDADFLHTAIYALKWARMTGRKTIDELMRILGAKKNQYIRAAMYAILLKSEVLEENIEYLLEGYELIDKIIIGDRSDTSLMDEGWNLKECIKSIKSVKGIKRITEYIAENKTFDHGYDTEKVLEAIILNSIYAYNNDNNIFYSILAWFQKDIRSYRMEKAILFLQFFDQTNTRKKAFDQIWQLVEDKERNKVIIIAKLITPEFMQFILDEYLIHNITQKELEEIYINMGWSGNENQAVFEKLILDKANIKIMKPEQIDYEGLRKTKQKEDFNLLFDKIEFEKATLKIFEDEKKDTFSFDDLFTVRKDNNSWADLEVNYSDVALRLLRDFVNNRQSINKEQVMNWFEKGGNEEWYRVSIIYEYLKNRKEIEISDEQKQWITRWCMQNVEKVNFRTAIEVENDRISFNTMAMQIWYFSNSFNINHEKKVLLDMLSFDTFEAIESTGIKYLFTKLNHTDIVARMLKNLKEGIADNTVMKNHIKYLSQHRVEESYPFILNEISNAKRSEYDRGEFLNAFYEYTKNTESLKTIIDKVDSAIKWSIIEKLRINYQEQFVIEYLLNSLNEGTDSGDRGKAAEILVTMGNIEGLRIYVDWVKKNVINDIDISNTMCLNNLRSADAIPFLLELLEISYIKEIKVDRLDRFNDHVLSALYNVALVSEGNFDLVKSRLETFIKEKSNVHDNVKYILFTIERLEEQIYLSRIQTYSIKQVKEKVQLIL